MKRMHRSSVVGFLLMLFLLATAAAGCGTTLGSTQADPSTPLGSFQLALANLGQMPTLTGDINATITITGDPAAMPAAAQLIFGQPITVSGTYSYDKNSQSLQASLTIPIAGQSLPLAIAAVNDQAWLQFTGQWYQMPISAQPLTGGLDPSTWLTDVKLVGDETVQGTSASHLSATVDVSRMAADIAKLKNSGALGGATSSTAAGSSASNSAGASTTQTTLTEQEIQQLEAKITGAIQSLTLDAWVTKDSHQPLQIEVKTTIVPPAQTTGSTSATSGLIQGIKSVSIDATVSVAPSPTPVTVTPPADAKHWSDLQTTLQGFMSLFGGGLGGGSTATSAP